MNTVPGPDWKTPGQPVWWYRFTILLGVSGIAYIIVSGLARNLVHPLLALFSGQVHAVQQQESNDGFVVAILAIWGALLPFVLTVAWFGSKERAAGRPYRPRSAARDILILAWGRPLAQQEEDEVSTVGPNDEAVSALFTVMLGGAPMGFFAWFFKPAPPSAATVCWALVLALLFGTSVYCLSRARPHLRESWLRAEQERFIPRKISFLSADYKDAGQRWVRRFWLFLSLCGAVWMGGFS